MALPGYAVEFYDQLAQIDVTNYKDKTVLFVAEKQNWYYLDKTDNNTWKPCTVTELESLINAKETFFAQNPNNPGLYNLIVSVRRQSDNYPPFQLIDRLVENQLPLETITKITTSEGHINNLITAHNTQESQINAINQKITNLENVAIGEVITYTTTEAKQVPTSPPRLDIINRANPNRTLFVIAGFTGLITMGGGMIINSSNPIKESFSCDFIGQQWLDTTNNELWIAVDRIDIHYGWRKVVLNPPVLNENYSNPPSR